jgi:hypothetical protein
LVSSAQLNPIQLNRATQFEYCRKEPTGGIFMGVMRLLILQVLLISFVVSPGRAELRSGFDMGLFGGSVSATAGISKNAGGGYSIASNISNGNIYGLRFGGNFYRYFGMELTLADTGTKYNAYLFDPFGDKVASEENTSIGLISFNGILQYPFGPVVPFVTVGAGRAMFIDYNLPTTNYGAGAKIFLSKRIFLRGDYKEHIVKSNHTVYEKIYSGGTFYDVPYPYTDKIRLREISAGLSVLF